MTDRPYKRQRKLTPYSSAQNAESETKNNQTGLHHASSREKLNDSDNDIIDDAYDSYDELFTQHFVDEEFVAQDVPKTQTPCREQSPTQSTNGAWKHTNSRKRFVVSDDKCKNLSSIIHQDCILPWAQQYPPTTLDELAVHKRKVLDVQNWFRDAFAGNQERRLLVLRGPAGSGKTTTVNLLSQTLGFDILEWKNPPVSEFATKGYVSVAVQFEEFLDRGNKFRKLDLDGVADCPHGGQASNSRYTQQRIILIEDLAAFRLSLQRYLANGPPLHSNGLHRNKVKVQTSYPIVIIVSETHLTSGSSSERLFNHPSTAIIEFNSIAPTFIYKALKLILDKESRHSKRDKNPGPAILQSISRSGDIRSAVASLEFLCLGVEERGPRHNLVTQREATLGIFHAVGKIVYNKRDDANFAAEDFRLPSPPDHMWHHDRPRVSQVPVNELVEETGTDTQTFIRALHENYVPSCDGSSFVDCVDACIGALSDSDVLHIDYRRIYGARTNTSASVDILRQEDISYQVAARGLLFSLPHPVKRRIASSSCAGRPNDAHKMFFPSGLRLMREEEVIGGLVNIWITKLLNPLGGMLSGLGLEMTPSSRKCRPERDDHGHDQAGIVTMIPREDLLLYQLPYMAKIHRGEVEISQLRRITSFNETGYASDYLGDDVHDSDESHLGSTSAENSRIPQLGDVKYHNKSNAFGPRLPPSYEQEETLVLSDDDIMSNRNARTLVKRSNDNKNTSPCVKVEGGLRKANANLVGPNAHKGSYASLGSITTAATYATLPGWTTIALMVSLIFGGCCANVVYTAFFVTVNLLNNWAFAYKISVPLHIILRSGGPVASMVIGYVFNAKKYSHGQILAVAMLTIGVIAAALADAHTKGQPMSIGDQRNDSTTANTLIGFSILALAMVLSAFQGIYADRLYESYGRNHWKEALFYSHTLSLPLFIPTYPHLLAQWRTLLSSPSLLSGIYAIAKRNDSILSSPVPFGTELAAPSKTSFVDSVPMSIISTTTHLLAELEHSKPIRLILTCIPTQVFYLLMNAFTQYLCIRGVHLLSAKSSSLTVTIVLNVRKLVSLLLSIYLFGNNLAPGVLVGAIFVFVGGALYGFEGARLRKISIKKD
ncbi:putative cell cycle checkpoint protein Rad17 [Aspergillus alliaceus]|uniref:putative cell cycle checkpoint protein Rad17 n=1 Tax=Petromyces alliaceus TaxID=209559 RepID=UPI0012A68403|nr:UAA transporter family-domain-containing protein [Aspergillus alliaceus]KAB8227822.1 UAA transporter family-domain-containing protein [Aspergillus alliaceus]